VPGGDDELGGHDGVGVEGKNGGHGVAVQAGLVGTGLLLPLAAERPDRQVPDPSGPHPAPAVGIRSYRYDRHREQAAQVALGQPAVATRTHDLPGNDREQPPGVERRVPAPIEGRDELTARGAHRYPRTDVGVGTGGKPVGDGDDEVRPTSVLGERVRVLPDGGRLVAPVGRPDDRRRAHVEAADPAPVDDGAGRAGARRQPPRRPPRRGAPLEDGHGGRHGGRWRVAER
jgi:hypothetical protein